MAEGNSGFNEEDLQTLREQVTSYYQVYYSELREQIKQHGASSVPVYVRGHRKLVCELCDDGALISHFEFDGEEDVYEFVLRQGELVRDRARHRALKSPGWGVLDVVSYRPGAEFGAGTYPAPLRQQAGSIIYRTNWVRLEYASRINLDRWDNESEAVERARKDIQSYVQDA